MVSNGGKNPFGGAGAGGDRASKNLLRVSADFNHFPLPLQQPTLDRHNTADHPSKNLEEELTTNNEEGEAGVFGKAQSDAPREGTAVDSEAQYQVSAAASGRSGKQKGPCKKMVIKQRKQVQPGETPLESGVDDT